jgi:hypothetical protein
MAADRAGSDPRRAGMPHHETSESPGHPEAAAKKGDFAKGPEEDRGAEDEHRGDFAEGQAGEHVAPDALPGDFARGQEARERTGEDEHRGGFAEGQERHDAEGQHGGR